MAEPQTDELLTSIEQNTRDTAEAVTATSAVVSDAAQAAEAVLAQARIVSSDKATAAAVAAAKVIEAAEQVRLLDARNGRRTTDQAKPPTIVTPAGAVVATPTSTEEEDRNTAGQRAVNMLWENTQRQVALSVIGSALFVAIVLAVGGGLLAISNDLQLAAAVFLFGVANLVTGFYFGRTNHQRVGGIQQGR